MFDNQGLPLTAANIEATSTYNAAVTDWLNYRLSAMPALKKALELDPGFCMAHCLRGSMLMAFNSAAVHDAAQSALRSAQNSLAAATTRERLHVVALDALVNGNPQSACARWEQVLADNPLDIVALRLHHYVSLWAGQRQHLSFAPSAVLPSWTPDVANYGNVLGMLAFGLEELGAYEDAESFGREAAARNPDDLWAVHSVAHVMEMQQRPSDGVDWLNYPLNQWADRNPFRGHLWWHRGLFLLELDRLDEALNLYDSSIHDASSEFFMDVHNSVSFLVRLEFKGIDVGNRWDELADCAESNTDRHALPFTDIHHVLALARCGRSKQARAHVQSMKDCANRGENHVAQVLRRVAIPICEGLIDYEDGVHASALETITTYRPRLGEIGASNAQRELITLIAIEAARRSRRESVLRHLSRERSFAMRIARRDQFLPRDGRQSTTA